MRRSIQTTERVFLRNFCKILPLRSAANSAIFGRVEGEFSRQSRKKQMPIQGLTRF
jgi:hypothetical protein